MKLVLLLLVAALALIAVQRLWFGFAAQRVTDYAGTGPALDIRRHLAGPMISEGVLFGPDGRVAARFVAEMRGEWSGDDGRLSEAFRYATGGSQSRVWTIRMGGAGRFTATAEDIVGTATGEQAGATARMRYRLRLPAEAGGHVLDVVDWFYLMENGTIINRSEMRKFGLKVAELTATIRPAP